MRQNFKQKQYQNYPIERKYLQVNCEKCDKIIGTSRYFVCDGCKNLFHIKTCVDEFPTNGDRWRCENCKNNPIQEPKNFNYKRQIQEPNQENRKKPRLVTSYQGAILQEKELNTKMESKNSISIDERIKVLKSKNTDIVKVTEKDFICQKCN